MTSLNDSFLFNYLNSKNNDNHQKNDPKEIDLTVHSCIITTSRKEILWCGSTTHCVGIVDHDPIISSHSL